jgi:hypothetical protein
MHWGSDINISILALKDAIRLTSEGHASRPNFLNMLGKLLKDQFQLTEELVDINNAVSILKDAVHLTPDDDPHKAICHLNLGLSLNHFDKTHAGHCFKFNMYGWI